MSREPKAPEWACTIRPLPLEEHVAAAEAAVRENPANAPFLEGFKGPPLSKQELAVLTGKYWGAAGKRFTVGFLDSPNAATRTKILAYMNRWATVAGANVSFEYSATDPLVRILRDPRDGYWSYLGTDILRVDRSGPTMNLAGMTERTADAEYDRVVVHETGHTLGCPHEHLRAALVGRIDPAKAIAFFRATSGWDEQTTRGNVLTPLEEGAILGTPAADEMSVMCYPLPGSITRDGRPIAGGPKLSAADVEFIRTIYPPAGGGGGGGAAAPVRLTLDPDGKTVTLTLPAGWRVTGA